MAVDQTVWTKARERAEEIATDIIRSQTNSSNTELSPEARAKVRSTANRLIVIDSDTSVTVYNTVSQATQARKAKREATQTDDMESTPE